MTKATIGYLSNKVNGISIKSTYKAHASNYTNYKERNIRKIIIHYTGNKKDTAKANAKYFANNRSLGASAHFFVDETSIFQSVEIRDVAHHAGNWLVNCESIGIEMCTSGDYKVSAKTKTNTAYLVADLCKRYGISADEVDKCVLRHYDITGKNCPAQMATKNNGEWAALKKLVKDILKPKSTSYKVKVTASALNVRKGAGVSYSIVKTLKKNATVTITESKKVGSSTWGKISGSGWINLGYTKKV